MNTCLTWKKLQLIIYQTCVSNESLKGSCSGKELSDSEEGSSRIGNTLWCTFGKCKSNNTYAKSICFLDKEKIPERYLEDIILFL